MLVLTGAALLAAPAREANGASENRGRIVVLGDSITAGYGLDPDQAYPALLQKKIDAAGFPFTVVNAGVSGDTTAGGLRRLNWALGNGADVLVVALGGNDGLRGIPPAQTEKNLASILSRAKEKSPHVKLVLAAMRMPDNMGRDFTQAFASVFPRVAEREGAKLVPFLLEGVGGVDALNQADRIHPTPEGQVKVAENVWAVLLPVLKEAAGKEADKDQRTTAVSAGG